MRIIGNVSEKLEIAERMIRREGYPEIAWAVRDAIDELTRLRAAQVGAGVGAALRREMPTVSKHGNLVILAFDTGTQAEQAHDEIERAISPVGAGIGAEDDVLRDYAKMA